MPPENARAAACADAGYRAIFQACGQRRAAGRSEPLFLQPGQMTASSASIIRPGRSHFAARTWRDWVCQAAPEERAALEKEIARLQDEIAGFKQEVAGLKQEVANLRAPPPPPRPPADLTPPGKDDSAQLREDIARAREAL